MQKKITESLYIAATPEHIDDGRLRPRGKLIAIDVTPSNTVRTTTLMGLFSKNDWRCDRFGAMSAPPQFGGVCGKDHVWVTPACCDDAVVAAVVVLMLGREGCSTVDRGFAIYK